MRSLVPGLALFFALGCSATIADLNIVSTKTTDLGQPHYRSANQASASDGRLWITILPLGGAPSINTGINNLLAKYNGDYLTDAKIEESWWSLLVISYGAIDVKGDVWTAGSAPPPKP